MFNLNINKDDTDLTTSTKLMAADKISKFKRGKIGAYTDWYLIKNTPYYRVYGVVVASIRPSDATSPSLFIDNQQREVKLLIYLQTPRLDDKIILSWINSYDPTFLDNSVLNKVFGVNKIVNENVIHKLISGIHIEKSSKYIDEIDHYLEFIGVPKSNVDQLRDFKLESDELTAGEYTNV